VRAEPNLLESDNEDLQPDITLIVPIFGCSPLDHDFTRRRGSLTNNESPDASRPQLTIGHWCPNRRSSPANCDHLGSDQGGGGK
jgi:hypothetical protein